MPIIFSGLGYAFMTIFRPPLVLLVALTASLRLLLAARTVRKEMPGMLSRLGMVSRTEAAA
jgi:hypothetical protein